MKSVAVIYAGLHGTSAKVAHIIENKIGEEHCQVFDLKQVKKIDLSSFRYVIVGGSVHAGQVHSALRNFCKQNLTNLLEKKLLIFMCGMNEKEYTTVFEKGFPEILRKHSIYNAMAGGEYLFEKMNFFEKFLVKKIAGAESSQSMLKYPQIDALCSSVSL